MSSTLTDLVTDVKDRLVIGSAGAVPTDAMLTRWLLSAFKSLIALLPPVKESSATVGADRQIALPADQVFYVANGAHLLYSSEWNKRGNVLILQPSSVKDGDAATCWYVLDPGITSSTTSVDTTCIFGTDWLESLAILKVLSAVEGRLANTSDSADAGGHASMQRVLDDEFNALFAMHKQRWNDWRAEMELSLQHRSAFGEPPPKNPPRAGFVNNSEIRLNLLAQGDDA